MIASERAKHIAFMLEQVEEGLDEHSSAREFIDSLQDQFDREGDLSDKQVDALTKFF